MMISKRSIIGVSPRREVAAIVRSPVSRPSVSVRAIQIDLTDTDTQIALAGCLLVSLWCCNQKISMHLKIAFIDRDWWLALVLHCST
jgi:hypothetical protein